MTKDTEIHREIRERILNGIDGKCSVAHSHGTEGKDVLLFRTLNDKQIDLAKPDMLIQLNGRTLIIEIEKSNSPKKMLGDAAAVSESFEWKWGPNPGGVLGRTSLLTVLPKSVFEKKGSGKPDQIMELGRLMRRRYDFDSVRILSDDKAIPAIENWLATGSLFFKTDARGRLSDLETKIGYRFEDGGLLVRAMLRPGNVDGNQESSGQAGPTTKDLFAHNWDIQEFGNQGPLATIGDSALNLAITSHFYELGEDTPELLSRPKADLAKNKLLGEFARTIPDFDGYILWSNNESKNEKTVEELATTFEALIGAVYLDNGMPKVCSVLDHIRFFDWDMKAGL
jgi:hypothetical protein